MIGNEWWEAIIKGIAMATAVSLMRQAEPALNKMTRETLAVIRVAFVLLTAGSGAIVLWVFGGMPADVPATMLSAGAALLMSIDRRRGGWRDSMSSENTPTFVHHVKPPEQKVTKP